MADSQRKTANLCDIDDISLAWAYTSTSMKNTLNQLSEGNYVLTFKSTLTSRNDTSDTSLTGFIAISSVSGANISYTQLWQLKDVGDFVVITANITITSETKGNFTNAYFYGCGINNVGATGSAIISDIMLNSGSTPLPYEPYGWVHSLRKLGTSTDTITTLPADLYADGNNATVGLVGNMEQSGSPSPSSIIIPQECGERTGNLFDEVYQPHVGTAVIYKPIYVGNGEFTLSTNMIKHAQIGTLFLLAGNVSSGAKTGVNNVYINNPITVTSIDGYVTIGYRKYNENTPDPEDYNVMLNTGSTPLPYENFGYKIPISSADTTTPVYLGEVQSTRQIYRFTLTGTENVTRLASGSSNLYLISPPYDPYYSNTATGLISNSYVPRYNNNDTSCYFSNATPSRIVAVDNRFTTADDFKNYCAQQYLSGNPVIFWYVLATPTTGIVNEPLRKIGDYADEVSSITIPTIAGANTLSVGTTLQPSEVTVNYKGWHPVADVHEYDSNYTIATMQALTIAQLQTYTISDLQGGEWS